MPVSKTAEKEMRVAERRHLRNKAAKTAVKSKITKAEQMIKSGAEDARKAAAAASSALDKAATKGKIHPNSAARHKSRLMIKVNKAAASATAPRAGKTKAAKSK